MSRRKKAVRYWFEQPCELSQPPKLRRATGVITGEWFKYRGQQKLLKDTHASRIDAVLKYRSELNKTIAEINEDILALSDTLRGRHRELYRSLDLWQWTQRLEAQEQLK